MAVIWKGQISFGLVNIPVEVFSAEKRTEIRFHLLDCRDNSRIHYERVNEETGKEVPWNKVVKAFEFSKNKYVLLRDADFKRVAPKATKTIEIENFVNIHEISYIYFERPYYLIPNKMGEKGYILLRETLKRTKKVGIAKVVIREKQYLAAVLPIENALMLNILRFQQELHAQDEFDLPEEDLDSYHISSKEIDMAEQLVKGMTKKWIPKEYHDDYREKLMDWIEKQEELSSGKKKAAKKSKKEKLPDNTIDFMAALKKSLQDVKNSGTHAKTRKIKQ